MVKTGWRDKYIFGNVKWARHKQVLFCCPSAQLGWRDMGNILLIPWANPFRQMSNPSKHGAHCNTSQCTALSNHDCLQSCIERLDFLSPDESVSPFFAYFPATGLLAFGFLLFSFWQRKNVRWYVWLVQKVTTCTGGKHLLSYIQSTGGNPKIFSVVQIILSSRLMSMGQGLFAQLLALIQKSTSNFQPFSSYRKQLQHVPV